MLAMLPNAIRHMDEDDVERYSMGDLPEDRCVQFEEHLLICEVCQNRVAESDRFVRSVQRAGRQIRQDGAVRDGHPAWKGWAIRLAAAGLAAVILFALIRATARK